MNYDSPLIEIGLKLLVAMLCSGAIGLERELSLKPAGLRTNVLIGMGAALFMITSRHISGGAAYTDPARLVAQVVSGVGFIGAGVILQSRGSVVGLTTAATIFVVTALGIAIGEGMFGPAVLATVLIIFVLVLLRRAERAILRRRRMYHYTFKTNDPASALARLLDLLEAEGARLEDFNVREIASPEHEVEFSIITSVSENKRLIEILPRLGEELRASTRE
ncbi:MAG TPA: MgtC/SapB family protein [Pyrinomonadaceae bacterium]|jgi:putative Mg2+ transporter-C (MgtC) family protein|nr:MgtC/SapB family protein [Pyrinomonadaceae bacterium]